jgi:hypothetical protein
VLLAERRETFGDASFNHLVDAREQPDELAGDSSRGELPTSLRWRTPAIVSAGNSILAGIAQAKTMRSNEGRMSAHVPGRHFAAAQQFGPFSERSGHQRAGLEKSDL